MKILIATKNKDKFKIISKMITSILGDLVTIESLIPYKDYREVEETGNNIERAKGKALNAKDYFKDKYDLILGIDDGIILNNHEYVAVKEHLYDIVSGDKIKIKDKIFITRAYYLLAPEKEKYCYNKIPYILQKKIENFEQIGYPLNRVISTIEDEKVLIEHTEEELNDYFLKYSIDDLKELFKDYR